MVNKALHWHDFLLAFLSAHIYTCVCVWGILDDGFQMGWNHSIGSALERDNVMEIFESFRLCFFLLVYVCSM